MGEVCHFTHGEHELNLAGREIIGGGRRRKEKKKRSASGSLSNVKWGNNRRVEHRK